MSLQDQLLTEEVKRSVETIYNGGTFPVVNIKPDLKTEEKKSFLIPVFVVIAIIYFMIKR